VHVIALKSCSPWATGNQSDEVYREIVHDTLQQIDLVYRLINAFPEHLEQTYTAASIRKTFQSTSKIASLMGIEGLHQIGNSASILRTYYNLGVRYATLTHTCHNAYADSEEPLEPLHGGISEAGEKLVKEMNRIGMIVDLSHTSFATQRAVLKLSRAPVIFSHSNAYALHNHTRNVPDDILHSLAEHNGVIMVTFYPSFLAHDRKQASLQMVADQIEYIGNLIGYRYVGLGSDFDGMDAGPKGLEDVSKYPDLIKEMERRGVKKAALMGIMGGNVLRVLESVEQVALKMKDVLPLEDNVKPFFRT
jgi:membrane dipeptidase